MDNLRDQMEALAQGIVTSAREREIAVGDSKVRTAGMLQAFGLERMAMGKDSKSGFAADRAVRSVDVRAMLADTNAMCEGFRQDHVRMGRSLRRKLVETTEEVASFVASLRADFAKGRVDFAKAHRHMTKAQRAALVKDRGDRSREVAGLMNDFHVSRGEMAQQLAEGMAKFTQEIRSHVSGLTRFGAVLEKTREDARVPRRIPNSLLAVRVPFSAPGHEPEVGREKTKSTFSESVRAFVGKSEKPKKKK